jgi:hypothetical protein
MGTTLTSVIAVVYDGRREVLTIKGKVIIHLLNCQ